MLFGRDSRLKAMLLAQQFSPSNYNAMIYIHGGSFRKSLARTMLGRPSYPVRLGMAVS